LRPIVHSVKHYVQLPINQITTGSIENNILVEAVEGTLANLATEVVEGTLVKAVFIEMWLQNTGTLGEQILILEKVPQGGAGIVFAQAAIINSYVNKKNVLFVHQGLSSNDGVSGPQVLIRQWFKIPKGKQRFGLGDRLILSISNVSSNDLNRCGFATYKEYS